MKFIKKLLTGLIPALAIIFTLLLTSCSDFANSSDSGSATLTLDGRAIASKLAPLFAEASETAAADSLVELIVEVHYSYDGKKENESFTVLSMTENERAKLEKNATDAERNTYITEKINAYPLVVENLPVGKDVLFGMKVFFSTNGDKEKFAISKERKSVRIGTDTSVSLTLTNYSEKYDWEIAQEKHPSGGRGSVIKLTLKIPDDTDLSDDSSIMINPCVFRYHDGWSFSESAPGQSSLDKENKTATVEVRAFEISAGEKVRVGITCMFYDPNRGNSFYFKGLSEETTVGSGTSEITITLEGADESYMAATPAPDTYVYVDVSGNSVTEESGKYLRITIKDGQGIEIATKDEELNSALNQYSETSILFNSSDLKDITDGTALTAEATVYSDASYTTVVSSGEIGFTFFKNSCMINRFSLFFPVQFSIALTGTGSESLEGMYYVLTMVYNNAIITEGKVGTVSSGGMINYVAEKSYSKPSGDYVVTIEIYENEASLGNSDAKKYYCNDKTVTFEVSDGSPIKATTTVTLSQH